MWNIFAQDWSRFALHLQLLCEISDWSRRPSLGGGALPEQPLSTAAGRSRRLRAVPRRPPLRCQAKSAFAKGVEERRQGLEAEVLRV